MVAVAGRIWAPFVSGHHTPPILNPVEHDQVAVAVFVASLVLSDGFLALSSVRDKSLYLATLL